MTKKHHHRLTKLSPRARCQMYPLLNLLSKIRVLSIDNLHKGYHKGVQRVCGIKLVEGWQVAHEGDVVGCQFFKLVDDLDGLLVANLELVDLKSLPGVYFFGLGFGFGGDAAAGGFGEGGAVASNAQLRGGLFVDAVKVDWLGRLVEVEVEVRSFVNH